MGYFDPLIAFLFSLTSPLLFCSFPSSDAATSSVVPGQPLTDGDTIVSPGGVFELGFFSPSRSTNRYVGIWYHNFSKSTVVWVANRESPVPDSAGLLSISGEGNLVVFDGRKRVLWTSGVSLSSGNSTAELLDTGNLVLQNSGTIAWRSFDHPTDTYLAGMKVGLDLRSNVNHLFTSWKSAEDPAPGNFSMGMNPDRSTQIFIWENGKPRWRSGRWNGQVFIGVEDMVPEYIYGFRLSNFEAEGVMYFYYNYFNSTQRYVLTDGGLERQLLWHDTDTWQEIWAQPSKQCEIYNRCGNYASCTEGENSSPECSCLKGFVPKSGGCERRTALQCKVNRSHEYGEPDRFYFMQKVKLPDFSDWDSGSLNATQCEESCLANCSCEAYSFVTGIGCLIWGTELMDIHIFSNGGNDFFIRLAASEFVDKKIKVSVFLVLVISIPALVIVGSICLLFMFRKRIRDFFKQRKRQPEAAVNPTAAAETEDGFSAGVLVRERSNGKCKESAIFNFDTIVEATDNFSYSNLLGEGGFGPVYKGILPGGQEIAVKRLSDGSGQGIEQFKNEVILIAKLQHRNLVRLLGSCAERDDKMLIYEYMPNRSLDAFLFDQRLKRLLDWNTRYNIIEGIGRGLLYLHRDSRLRIIHRDLKASNILLDGCMNPKISDFGMARIFGSDGNETTTKRVVGTYGYMSPEYAMKGNFSVKSDVYSFGVLILEIISGERNSTFQHPDLYLNLISYAWKLWKEDNVMEFVDPSTRDSCLPSCVSRCIYVGLSCVQDRANERPTTAMAIMMLEGGAIDQPTPRQPTFAFERDTSVSDSTDPRFISDNSLMITMLSGR